MDKETAEEIAELIDDISDERIKLYDHRISCRKNEWTESIQRIIQLKEEMVRKLIIGNNK